MTSVLQNSKLHWEFNVCRKNDQTCIKYCIYISLKKKHQSMYISFFSSSHVSGIQRYSRYRHVRHRRSCDRLNSWINYWVILKGCRWNVCQLSSSVNGVIIRCSANRLFNLWGFCWTVSNDVGVTSRASLLCNGYNDRFAGF